MEPISSRCLWSRLLLLTPVLVSERARLAVFLQPFKLVLAWPSLLDAGLLLRRWLALLLVSALVRHLQASPDSLVLVLLDSLVGVVRLLALPVAFLPQAVSLALLASSRLASLLLEDLLLRVSTLLPEDKDLSVLQSWLPMNFSIYHDLLELKAG